MSSVREALPWAILTLLAGRSLWKRYGRKIKAFFEEEKAKRPWSLNPKTPDDCPACVEEVRLRKINAEPQELPPPWESSKGPGGPKKKIDTEGYCCDNPDCRYFLIREAHLHALVGSGIRGITDDIQRLLCQACDNRFNVQRYTALKDLKTSPERIELAMNLAAEGVSIAVIARVLGHCEETIAAWLERTGRQARLLHDVHFRDLELPYLQVDELQTKVRAYPGEKAWLWVAIDPVLCKNLDHGSTKRWS